jgi:hypothetical protein
VATALPTTFAGPPATHSPASSIHRPYHGGTSRDFVTIPVHAPGTVPTCAHADIVKLAVAENTRSAAFATVTRALVPLN